MTINMKFINILILAILAVNCSAEVEDVFEESITNNTNFTVKITQSPNLVSQGSENFNLTLKPNESIKINTRNKIITTAIVTPLKNTDKVFSVDIVNGGYAIKSFSSWVTYKITGSSKKADLTFSTPLRGTGQKSVTLPHDVSFKESFVDEFLYISAQNTDEGTVKVEIFYRDEFKQSDTCSGFACIATSQSTIR